MNEESAHQISGDDAREFRAYLHTLTDRQVQGCFEKERDANRHAYVELVRAEAERRNITLEG
jgi:hypothetical protein